MSIANLDVLADQYYAYDRQIRQALDDGMEHEALELCEKAWEFVNELMWEVQTMNDDLEELHADAENRMEDEEGWWEHGHNP